MIRGTGGVKPPQPPRQFEPCLAGMDIVGRFTCGDATAGVCVWVFRVGSWGSVASGGGGGGGLRSGVGFRCV